MIERWRSFKKNKKNIKTLKKITISIPSIFCIIFFIVWIKLVLLNCPWLLIIVLILHVFVLLLLFPLIASYWEIKWHLFENRNIFIESYLKLWIIVSIFSFFLFWDIQILEKSENCRFLWSSFKRIIDLLAIL